MRLSYIFAVVLVAILQSSGTAHPVYEDSKQIVSAGAGDATKVDSGRLLRGVEEKMEAEDEERLFPSSEQMEEFAKQLPGITDFADIVDKYVMLAHLDGDYFLCNHQDMKDAAGMFVIVFANPARAEKTFINKHPTLSALDQKIRELPDEGAGLIDMWSGSEHREEEVAESDAERPSISADRLA
eukprot:jgi/Phyca11/20944/fgenesh1_pg.PHYCAscaffold_77_\